MTKLLLDSPGAPAAATGAGLRTPPAAPDQPSPGGPWLPSLVVAGVGLAISFDLLLRTLALMQDRVPGGIDVCTALFRVGCDKTLASSQSWRLGVPAAGWGLAYFATLAWLVFLARAIGGWFARRAAAAAMLLVIPGVFISITLSTSIVLGRVPMCPLCLLVHGVNLALAVLLWRAGGFHWGTFGRMFGDGLRWTVGPPGAEPPEARWTLVGVTSAALVGLVAFQWSAIQVERHGGASAAFDAGRVFRAYDAEPVVDLAVTENDPRMGPPGAPAQLVVFSDFECPGCSELAPEIDAIAVQHGDEVSVVFKHYPLSTECNPAARDDRHPGACAMAAASEAARWQGKFWPFHDLAFENVDGAADSVLRRMARDAGLDLERFERDLRDTTAMARVKNDVALGNRIGLEGTPTVYLNGRKVPELSARTIEALVDRVIQDTGHRH